MTAGARPGVASTIRHGLRSSPSSASVHRSVKRTTDERLPDTTAVVSRF